MNELLCRLGHVANVAELHSAGLRHPAIAALRTDPKVYRPRRGVYACAHLNSDERLAVDCGIRLDCISVLREHGIWVGHAVGLHVRLHPDGGRAAGRLELTGARVTRHWAARTAGGGLSIRVNVVDALLSAFDCLPPDDVVAAIESAVHVGSITPQQAFELVRVAPRRLQRALRELDPRAQSGLETIVRLRIRRHGYSVEPQAAVPGVGHLDNLIEGVVALETDGRSHEISVRTDRRRDLGTEIWGIRVIRVDPNLVYLEWPMVLAVIDRLISDARRASTRPAGSNPGDTPPRKR